MAPQKRERRRCRSWRRVVRSMRRLAVTVTSGGSFIMILRGWWERGGIVLGGGGGRGERKLAVLKRTYRVNSCCLYSCSTFGLLIYCVSVQLQVEWAATDDINM